MYYTSRMSHEDVIPITGGDYKDAVGPKTEGKTAPTAQLKDQDEMQTKEKE